MLKVDSFPAYQRQSRKVQGKRDALRLADGLLFALRIAPQGTDLVIWLGNPSHRDNREAMVAWVARERRSAGDTRGGAVRQILLHRLVRLLDEIGEDVAQG